jgi:hypothetical protein
VASDQVLCIAPSILQLIPVVFHMKREKGSLGSSNNTFFSFVHLLRIKSVAKSLSP